MSGDDILARVADNTSKRQTISYSGLRAYRLKNFRFEKEAVVVAQISYRPNIGKDFKILERSGNPRLSGIVEKLLASEAEASRPDMFAVYDFNTFNYKAMFRGIDSSRGRDCYVLDLTPRRRSRFLMKGALWVDRTSYGPVRLEGTTAASVSMWVGAPYIEQEFTNVDGLWLPIRTAATSSGMLLGTSHLEIRYSDYFVGRVDSSRKGALP
jgi:hypothetical protein